MLNNHHKNVWNPPLQEIDKDIGLELLTSSIFHLPARLEKSLKEKDIEIRKESPSLSPCRTSEDTPKDDLHTLPRNRCVCHGPRLCQLPALYILPMSPRIPVDY